MQSTRYSSQILVKLEFSRQIFEKKKISNIRFYENPFIGSRAVPCGRAEWCTDMRTGRVVHRHADGQSGAQTCGRAEWCTDMQTEETKVIVCSRNFGNAPQKWDGKVSLDSRSTIKTPSGNPWLADWLFFYSDTSRCFISLIINKQKYAFHHNSFSYHTLLHASVCTNHFQALLF